MEMFDLEPAQQYFPLLKLYAHTAAQHLAGFDSRASVAMAGAPGQVQAVCDSV